MARNKPRTPENYRLRFSSIPGELLVVPTTGTGVLSGSVAWEAPDDIRVVGLGLMLESAVPDASTNQDLQCNAIAQIVSGAQSYLELGMAFGWNGIFSWGDAGRKWVTEFFPWPTGFDMDEGESSLVLHVWGEVVAVAGVSLYVRGKVIWVER